MINILRDALVSYTDSQNEDAQAIYNLLNIIVTGSGGGNVDLSEYDKSTVVDQKIATAIANAIVGQMTEEQVNSIVETAIQAAEQSGEIATETWVDGQLATIPVLHIPEVFTVADPVVNTFTLDKTPLFISEVLVLNGDVAMYYLQASDYSVEGRNIIINNPALTPEWRVKVIYTYAHGS